MTIKDLEELKQDFEREGRDVMVGVVGRAIEKLRNGELCKKQKSDLQAIMDLRNR